jgi:hypothetical protein
MASEPITVRRVEPAGHERHPTETGSGPEAPPASIHAAPEPRVESIRLLAESREMVEQALVTLRTQNDPVASSAQIGRASDRIGLALHFLRQLLRH